jgi:hypothetical protein
MFVTVCLSFRVRWAQLVWTMMFRQRLTTQKISGLVQL